MIDWSIIFLQSVINFAILTTLSFDHKLVRMASEKNLIGGIVNSSKQYLSTISLTQFKLSVLSKLIFQITDEKFLLSATSCAFIL